MKRCILKKFDSKADKVAFEDENAKINLKNGSVMVVFIIAFELVMLIRAFIVYPRPFPLRCVLYMCCYSVLLTASLGLVISCMIIPKHPRGFTRKVNAVTIAYCVVIILWSIAITVLDSRSYEQYVVYMTVIVSVISLLRLPPYLFVAMEVGGLAVLSCALSFSLKGFRQSQLINLFVFTIVFLVISVTKYNTTVSEFYNNRKINNQNIELEQLNKLLNHEKEALEITARTDQLTGLYNRCFLAENVKGQLKECYDSGTVIGFAMFDIDDFKLVNDKFGHAVGDECLVRLGHCFRGHRQLTVYRYGGEEFLAVCEGVTEEQLESIIETVISEVSSFRLSVRRLRITISAGYICCVPPCEASGELLIGYADKALYAAKKAGKNRAVNFSKLEQTKK